MEKSTTLAGVVPAAIVEEAWQQVGASFERFCLTAGIATLAGMMEADAARLCGVRYARGDGRDGHRWGRTKGKLGFHAGKVTLERPRVRARDGGEVPLPSNIPSDMASGKPQQIDEERRLLYVAMTRAREHLHLLQPRQFYLTHQHRHGRGHVMVPHSRLLPDEVLGLFTRRTTAPNCAADAMPLRPVAPVDIGARLRDMWS